MLNMIYSQPRNNITCLACATCNLYEFKTGNIPPSIDEIIKWYFKAELSNKKGEAINDGKLRIPPSPQSFLTRLTSCPIEKVQVKSKKKVYASTESSVLNVTPLSLIKTARSGLCLSVRGDIELSKDNFIVRKTGVCKSRHFVACIGYDNNKKAFIIENSWGKDWGNNGTAYLKLQDFKPFVFEAWDVEFC